jgi:late competence protein required for DNA uptake (superfamily II DNA/RNA helicase)
MATPPTSDCCNFAEISVGSQADEETAVVLERHPIKCLRCKRVFAVSNFTIAWGSFVCSACAKK